MSVVIIPTSSSLALDISLWMIRKEYRLSEYEVALFKTFRWHDTIQADAYPRVFAVCIREDEPWSRINVSNIPREYTMLALSAGTRVRSQINTTGTALSQHRVVTWTPKKGKC